MVADDQTVVREGIVMLLGLLPGIEVVGAAGDGEEAVALVAGLAPDVVLMDLRMPRCDGVEATRRIRAEHPGTQVVVLTTFADDESLFPALGGGGPRLSHQGRGRGRDRASVTACCRRRGPLAGHPEAPAGASRRGPSPHRPRLLPPDGLTAREMEVLLLIAEGLSNPEIARRLHVSTATVKTHINNLFTKTGLKDRAQAVRYAYAKGLVRPPAG